MSVVLWKISLVSSWYCEGNMKVGDLVRWTEDKSVVGIVVGSWHCFFGADSGTWVLLMDGRKELFDPTQLEVVCK